MATTTKTDQQPNLKLYYFNVRGKGEPIRQLCAYAGLQLEDIRFLSFNDFVACKESGKLAFGQVPMLEVDGEHQLVQSAAILRYLSKLADLYPTDDPILAAKVDAALDQENDAFMGLTVASYTTRFGIDLDDDAKAKAYEAINAEILPRHLASVEKLYEASPTGWVAGTEKPSAADFAWYSRLGDYVHVKAEISEDIASLKDYPALKAFVEKYEGLDAIKAYNSASK